MIRYISLIIIFALTSLTCNAVSIFAVLGTEQIFETPSSSSGLSNLIVLRDASKGRVIFSEGTEAALFDFRGAAYATPVTLENGTTLHLSGGDTGIVATIGSETAYIWITDYAAHAFRPGTLTIDPDLTDCTRIAFTFSGYAAPIRYYSITGRGFDLPREIPLTYNDIVYDRESDSYSQKTITETLASVGNTLFADASGCGTEYTLNEDRFCRAWGIETEPTVSPYLEPVLIEAQTSVTQTGEKAENEKNVEATIGGSAPVNVSFSAVVTDGAIFHEWQFSRYAEFDDIDRRFTETDFEYTFTDAGTTYCRFIAADATGKCSYTSETYEVFIGESRLDCPNAFSPYGSVGVNDEWKVSYQSIISFECHIFNRWGKEMYAFYTPSGGWDGKFGGKLVPPGVYYYVIKAKGADGRSYNLSGDINLIRAKNSSATSANE